MGINSLEFAIRTAEQLDKKFVQASAVSFFEDNVLKAKFVGAKTVLVPEMDMVGLLDYDRDNGFANGSISVTNTPFVLSRDRARSFMIDREDEDEAGVANLAGQILTEFVRTKVVPEVDAYCLSALAKTAMDLSHTVTGTPASQAYKMFRNGMTSVQDEVGFDEELVCFVDSTFLTALETSTEVTRRISVENFKKGEVDFKVKSIDGVKLLPVPASRMKSAFTFTASGNANAGGFAPADGAKSIGFLIMPKKAASLVKKSEKLRTFGPDTNQKADAWKFDYRIYYDMLVKNSMKNAIFTYVY